MLGVGGGVARAVVAGGAGVVDGGGGGGPGGLGELGAVGEVAGDERGWSEVSIDIVQRKQLPSELDLAAGGQVLDEAQHRPH